MLVDPLLVRSQSTAVIVISILLAAGSSLAQPDDSLSPAELKSKSLEELMEMEVRLVSRRPERLTQAASAAQILTRDDIRRSGVFTLPEALRLAANVHVARIDARQWAVSARGFNTTTANKLLVMIDGRTVYTPLYSGVFWDVQNLFLEDIDRIEIVSGPGGTLWGANAVNGVINIVTREAAESQGFVVGVGAGLPGVDAAPAVVRDWMGFRAGGKAGDNRHFRVYGQRLDVNSVDRPDGSEGHNGWDLSQAGFRMDWQRTDVNRITMQGDMYEGALEQLVTQGQQRVPGTAEVDGQNLLGRWSRALAEGNEMELQLYVDRTWRKIPDLFAEELRTYDVDFHHRFRAGRHDLMWGLGYRLMEDMVQNSAALQFLPAEKTMYRFGTFLQDDFPLLPDRLKLTLGTKLEYNDFSGFEYQPAGRLAWFLSSQQTLWAAISRAVRAPSRIDVDFHIQIPVDADPADSVPPVPYTLAGGPDFRSEKLMAYELGYRAQPLASLSLSAAGFYNRYDDVRSVEVTAANTLEIANGVEAESFGLELSGRWRAADWLTLRGGYTWLNMDFSEKPGREDYNNAQAEGNDPPHMIKLHAMLDLPRGFQANAFARYVDELPSGNVPAYAAFDLSLVWEGRHVRIAVTGHNLFDESHPEFGSRSAQAPRPLELPRAVTGRVIWRM